MVWGQGGQAPEEDGVRERREGGREGGRREGGGREGGREGGGKEG